MIKKIHTDPHHVTTQHTSVRLTHMFAHLAVRRLRMCFCDSWRRRTRHAKQSRARRALSSHRGGAKGSQHAACATPRSTGSPCSSSSLEAERGGEPTCHRAVSSIGGNSFQTCDFSYLKEQLASVKVFLLRLFVKLLRLFVPLVEPVLTVPCGSPSSHRKPVYMFRSTAGHR